MDVGSVVKNARNLYEDLMFQNAKTYKELRKSDYSTAKRIVKDLKENNGEMYVDGYKLALDWMNIISPRYYIQGVDITLPMREKIYLEEYGKGNTNWDFFRKSICEYEEECFKQYAFCTLGNDGVTSPKVSNYLNKVKEINTFVGINTDIPYSENPKRFRELVKEGLDSRKKCQIIVSFTNRMIPIELRESYSKETLTYDEALSLCDIIIDNIDRIELQDKENYGTRTFQEMCVQKEDIIDEVVVGKGKNDEEGLGKLIMDSFVTNHLERCGVSRRIYSKYLKEELYFPNKKLCLALGLFLEPNVDFEKHSDEAALMDNVETFMNQNCLSIKSKFATVTEFDVLLDFDIFIMLDGALSIDVIAYMLEKFARTEKDFN